MDSENNNVMGDWEELYVMLKVGFPENQYAFSHLFQTQVNWMSTHYPELVFTG